MKSNLFLAILATILMALVIPACGGGTDDPDGDDVVSDGDTTDTVDGTNDGDSVDGTDGDTTDNVETTDGDTTEKVDQPDGEASDGDTDGDEVTDGDGTDGDVTEEVEVDPNLADYMWLEGTWECVPNAYEPCTSTDPYIFEITAYDETDGARLEGTRFFNYVYIKKNTETNAFSVTRTNFDVAGAYHSAGTADPNLQTLDIDYHICEGCYPDPLSHKGFKKL